MRHVEARGPPERLMVSEHQRSRWPSPSGLARSRASAPPSVAYSGGRHSASSSVISAYMSVSPLGHVGPLESSPRGQSLGAPHGISTLPPLQCRAAETPPETDVDASNPRPGAAAGSLSREQSARSCRTHLKKQFEKRSIVRHPSNSRGYTPLQKTHRTEGEMVGDGFKALSGPTLRQGGRREGGRNG